MKIFGFTSALVLLLIGPAQAQDSDAEDLSRYEIIEEGETIKTLFELQEMEDTYKKLVAAENCSAALPKIVEFYEAANIVSNVIRRGNEPYYDARLDRQKELKNDWRLFQELSAAESTSDKLFRQRNRAWVVEAKCLLTQGEESEAITRLYRALDYISANDLVLWAEARSLLWEQVGFKARNE